MKDDLDKLSHKWSEAQRTLEELGIQLSVSKLQISELKEQAGSNLKLNSSDPGGGSSNNAWIPDKLTSKCKGCNREFSMTRRKHHCRNCGEIFCHSCSEQITPLPNEQGQLGKPVRVCDRCWESISNKPNVM